MAGTRKTRRHAAPRWPTSAGSEPEKTSRWDTIDTAAGSIWPPLHYRKAYRDTVESLDVLKEAGDEYGHLNYTWARRLCELSGGWSLTLLGEWGAALRELDAAIALAERNGDRHIGGLLLAGALLVPRCWRWTSPAPKPAALWSHHRTGR